MASSEKRCLYEVLGLSRECSQDEIRSAYKKLALQRHPDKLVKSGLSQPEATAQFQELVHAYEVLSDPKERSWYDSHRSQILFADRNAAASANSSVPDLFSFFSNTVYSGYSDTGRGFYKVYSDLFSKIYTNEINFARQLGLGLDIVKEAPLMGNLECPYSQVTAFYNYWLGFSTVMDFVWVDEYNAMSGPNRKSRRIMEEENKKARKKAKREYNDSVRGLAEFVKKRDKRVIDMTLKRKEEMERKKEEERERKKKLENERLVRIQAYEEPEWAKVNEEEVDDDWDENDEKGSEKEEFYCVACGKKFKSEKQWKNHEQSKKHKEKVAELRESFMDEEEEEVEEDLEVEAEADVEEKFRDGLRIEEDGEDEGKNRVGELNEEEDGFFDFDEVGEEGVEVYTDSDQDEETSILEAMVSGRKDKKNGSFKSEEDIVSQMGLHNKDESDEGEIMEYNNRKNRRRNKTGKKEKGKKNSSDAMKSDVNETKSKNEEASVSGSFKSEEDIVSQMGLDNKDEIDEGEVMEYNNRKNRRRNKTEKKEKGKKNSSDAMKSDVNETKSKNEEASVSGSLHVEEKQPVEDEGSNGEEDNNLGNIDKISKKPIDRKTISTKETNTKSSKSSKGKKGKVTAKHSGNVCETCGEEFHSKTKLHKHLGDSGHATLKFR